MERATDVLARMAALPFTEIATLTQGKPILVLSPHPDDESLGCAGLIAQACAAGVDVHVVLLTDGSRSHPNSKEYPEARLIALREREMAAALVTLGLPSGRLAFFGYQDASAPRKGYPMRQAAEQLAAYIRDHDIGSVFASWAYDPHCDHLAAHRITVAASRMVPFRHLAYAVWGWTLARTTWIRAQRIRGWRLDITDTLAIKRAAVECHMSQMTTMIDDDPDGFILPDYLLDLCYRPFETFIQVN
ncbi:PIG-L deacetylase family protein [Acidisphaera sp. L21]|uniref:PIG-L deacetylase family protein n=1 Tax=Acidisphaera sp. L21 TaxID=1641851 RepID=UPI00131EA2E2|nr:PIG-L family deacetylase [Acidisphaera sp. L21]